MFPAGAAEQTFTISCWVQGLSWLWQAVAALRGMPRLPDLTRIDADSLPALPDADGPHLSVLVPACNEEPTIQATLRSLLESTGLRLQIIAIDDRSTDRTGALMEQVAAHAAHDFPQHTLTILRNRDLPAGWLGKPHALHLAAQQSTAPWLLFTDGDVNFAPRALELALRQALATQADHLVLMPTLMSDGWAEDAVAATMQVLAQWNTHLWKVADPRARDFLGVGGFNLLRSEVYARLGGMAALRMEVLEDMTLGWLVKHAGYRSCVVLGPGLVTIRWIQGVFGLVGNLEKNGFAVFRYSVLLTTAACLALVISVFLPLAAMAAAGWTLAAGLLTYLSVALVFQANRRMSGVSPLAAVLFAPAAAILCLAFARSMVLALLRRGVLWRGVLYPLSDLRRHAIRWR
jgi:hypothetical protein